MSVSQPGRRGSSWLGLKDPRRPAVLRRSIVAYAAIVLIIGWGYALWSIHRDRVRSVAAAKNTLATMATAIENHVHAMIHDGVGSAEAGAREALAQGGIDRDSVERVVATLQRMMMGGEYVREIFIATPSLYARARRAGAAGAGAGTSAQRPEWLAELFSQAHGGGTWIGPRVLQDPSDRSPVFPVAKRLPGTHGMPLWVGALFGVQALDRLYEGVPIPGGAVSLVSADGGVLLRAPRLPRQETVLRRAAVGEAFKDAGQRILGSVSGRLVFEARNPIDAELWVIAADRVDGYPLVAASGQSLDAALAAWRGHARSSIEFAVAFTIGVILLTAVLIAVLQGRYEALRRSEERFELAVAGSSDGLWDWDLRTGESWYSPRFLELLGYASSADFPPTAAAFREHVHPEEQEYVETALRRHLENHEKYDVEFRLRMRDGRYRWFRSRAQAVWDAAGAARIAGSISDVHVEKEAQASLRAAQARERRAREEFARQLLAGQDQERKRIANELHDSLGQNLSVISNRAQLAVMEEGLPPAAARHLGLIAAVAGEAIAEVRALARNLQPMHIDQLGLTESLRALLEQVSSSATFRLEWRVEEVDDALQGAAATHVYRILQEALTNAMRHAQARVVRVAVERDVHSVRLSVSDDGRGFEAAGSRPGGPGVGLASIAERARLLGGELRIRSQPGAGCEISVELPVHEPAAAAT